MGDEFFDAPDELDDSKTFFEVSQIRKDSDKPVQMPLIFEGGREEIAQEIEQFLQGLREVVLVNENLPAFLREGGVAMLDAWTNFQTTKGTESDRRRLFEAIDAFAIQAYDELEQPDAIEGVIASARLFDEDPMDGLADIVSAIEHLRLMFAVMVTEGDDFFFRDKLYNKFLQSVSSLDAELQVDVTAQSKDLYQDIVFPLIKYYVAPRLEIIVRNKGKFSLAYVHALVDFYGSVEYLRRAFADESMKMIRDSMVQTIKDSDLDELAEDLGDFTIDSEVDAYQYRLGVLAYVFSAEEDFGVNEEQAEAFVNEAFGTDQDRDPESSVEKGRVSMLYRLKHLLDLAMNDGAADPRLLQTDVRYKESFDVMNDILSQPDAPSRVGAMVQMCLEKYFVPLLDELTKSPDMDMDTVANFWVTILESSQIAAELHGLFEPNMSLNREMFVFDDSVGQWLKGLMDTVRANIGSRAVSSRPIFSEDMSIGSWVGIVAGTILTVGTVYAVVRLWNDYRKGTEGFVPFLIKRYIQSSKRVKVGLAAAFIVGSAMIARYGFGDSVGSITGDSAAIPTETSVVETFAFVIRDNARAFSLYLTYLLDEIPFLELEDGVAGPIDQFYYDSTKAYAAGAFVANSIAFANVFTIVMARWYNRGDSRPGAMKNNKDAQTFRTALSSSMGNLLGFSGGIGKAALSRGFQMLRIGGPAVVLSLWGVPNYPILGSLLAGALSVGGGWSAAFNASSTAFVSSLSLRALFFTASVGWDALEYATYASPVIFFLGNVALDRAVGSSRQKMSELAVIMARAGTLFAIASTAFFTNIDRYAFSTSVSSEAFNFELLGQQHVYFVNSPGNVTIALQGAALATVVAQTVGVFDFLADRAKEAVGFVVSEAQANYRDLAAGLFGRDGADRGSIPILGSIDASVSDSWLDRARAKAASQVIETTALALETQDTFNSVLKEQIASIQEAQSQL